MQPIDDNDTNLEDATNMFFALDAMNSILAHTTNILLADVVWYRGKLALKIRNLANP